MIDRIKGLFTKMLTYLKKKRLTELKGNLLRC